MTDLNIFTVPTSDFTINGYRMVPYDTVSSGITPAEFQIGSLDDFVDLSRSYLEIELQLVTAATNGIVADANSASDGDNTRFLYAVNNFAHSIIRQMNLRLNGTLMSEQTDTYAYTAFIQTLLNHNKEEGKTLLAPQGWVNQLSPPAQLVAAGANDDISTTAGWAHNNAHPLKTFTKKFHEKKKVKLLIRPHLDAFQTGRALVPQVEINLQLYFNSPDFFMFGTPTSGTGVKKFVTLGRDNVKVKLHLCHLALNASVFTSLQKQRMSGRWAKYPVVRSEIRTFFFNGNTTKFQEDNVFVGRVPDRLIVGLLRSEAFNGTVDWYPFAFQKFGVTSIKQIIDAEEYPYQGTLELNGDNALQDFMGYDRWLTASGAHMHQRPSMIEPDEWGQDKNCTLFMWDNVPSGDADGPHRNPRQAGNVKIEINFRTAPGNSLTVLVWGEFENVFEITDKANVFYNTSTQVAGRRFG